MSSPKQQSNAWDTNFGWWADKPERNVRPAAPRETYRTFSDKGERVWSEAALVVGLVVSLVLSLVALATR